MDLNAKIYVAGHGGMVGLAIIRRLAQVGSTNLLVCFNNDVPNGTLRKLMDVSKLFAAGWEARTDLATDLRSVHQDFLTGAGKNLHLA